MEHNRKNILRLKHVVSLSTTDATRARRASSEIDVAGTSLFSIDSPIQLVGSVSISHQATLTREKCVYRGETAVVTVSSCQLGRLVAFPWTFSFAIRTRNHEIEFRADHSVFSSRFKWFGGYSRQRRFLHPSRTIYGSTIIGLFVIATRDILFTWQFTRSVRKHTRQLALIETLAA